MKSSFKKLIEILKKIIQIQLNIVLSLLYFILILPYSFVYKKSFRPKDNKNQENSFWIDIKSADKTLDSLRRQF